MKDLIAVACEDGSTESGLDLLGRRGDLTLFARFTPEVTQSFDIMGMSRVSYMGAWGKLNNHEQSRDDLGIFHHQG